MTKKSLMIEKAADKLLSWGGFSFELFNQL